MLQGETAGSCSHVIRGLVDRWYVWAGNFALPWSSAPGCQQNPTLRTEAPKRSHIRRISSPETLSTKILWGKARKYFISSGLYETCVSELPTYSWGSEGSNLFLHSGICVAARAQRLDRYESSRNFLPLAYEKQIFAIRPCIFTISELHVRKTGKQRSSLANSSPVTPHRLSMSTRTAGRWKALSSSSLRNTLLQSWNINVCREVSILRPSEKTCEESKALFS